MRVKSLVQEHNTMSTSRAQTLCACLGVERTNHGATVTPNVRGVPSRNLPGASTVYCAVNIDCVLHCCLSSELWKTEEMQVLLLSCYSCGPCPRLFVEESPVVPTSSKKGPDV